MGLPFNTLSIKCALISLELVFIKDLLLVYYNTNENSILFWKIYFFPLLSIFLIIIKININFKKVSFCLSKDSKSFFQKMKLEMLNNIKDSLERKTASVLASIEVLEKQIERDKEN